MSCQDCPGTELVYSDTRAYAQIQPSHLHPLKQLEYMIVDDFVNKEFQRPVFFDDGSLEYPRLSTSVIPPDDIDGFRRDPVNSWRFIPEWPPCELRMQGVLVKQSGCIQTSMLCNHPRAEQYGKEVKCATCSECPLRGS